MGVMSAIIAAGETSSPFPLFCEPIESPTKQKKKQTYKNTRKSDRLKEVSFVLPGLPAFPFLSSECLLFCFSLSFYCTPLANVL